MKNSEKFEQLIREANRLEGHRVWDSKDYKYMAKGFLNRQYTDNPKENEKFDYSDFSDYSIPLFDNVLISLIHYFEKQCNEHNFIFNGDFNGAQNAKEHIEKMEEAHRRFEFCRTMLRIHNKDAYYRFID